MAFTSLEDADVCIELTCQYHSCNGPAATAHRHGQEGENMRSTYTSLFVSLAMAGSAESYQVLF